jgi:hypothetical protein
MYTSEFKTREKNRLSKDFAVEKASVKSKTEGIAIGETRGIAIGETAKAEEIAMKLMRRNNFAFEEIAEITGLTVHQIKMLQIAGSGLN